MAGKGLYAAYMLKENVEARCVRKGAKGAPKASDFKKLNKQRGNND